LPAGGTDVLQGLADIFGGDGIAAARTGGGAVAWGLLMGIPAGLVFFLAFIYYQISVRDNGAGLAGAFAKLGILVPMSLSLVLWLELPTRLQWFGMTLALGSIVLVNVTSLEGWTKSLRPALLMLFLLGGLAEFSNKIFQKYGAVDYRLVFLLTTFAVAGVLAFGTTIRKRLPVTGRDVLVGLAVGLPNLFSSFFLIAALDQIAAAVVFPVFAAGTIVIINVVGMVVFREKLSPREYLAVGLTIVALILINL
jgi:drug/metabolite transporter (DMT)-like permease